MIKTFSCYSDITDKEDVLELVTAQMKHIGASEDKFKAEKALQNALREESRALLFIIFSRNSEKPAGFAFANICSGLESGGDYLWLNELHIHPSFRSKGLAKEMLDFIEDWAVKKNIRYMACITSSENKPARALYRTKGYELEPTHWVDKTLDNNGKKE